MNECPGWERLSQSDSWTAAERQHVAACPRCASFVAEYHTFLAGDAHLPDAERDDAGRGLSEFIRGQVLPAVPSGPAGEGASPGWLERLSAWFATPPARWATSFAAVALIAGALVINREPELRVGAAQRGAIAAEFAASVTRIEGGAAQVKWNLVSQADRYRVEVLGTDLAVLESFEAGSAVEWTVDPASAPSSAYVRIVAMRKADRLAETSLLSLPGR